MKRPTRTCRHTRQLRWPAFRAAAAAVALCAPALAGEVVTARPHTLYVGTPRGHATASHVDAQRTRSSPQLPPADAADVVWQRQIPGGIGCNVLVDDIGRVFAAGPSRVTQLGADGALLFTQAAPFSAAVAAALLGDGSRALLTRDGHVMAWSESGAMVFDVVLDTPPPSAQSALLPLPDGGLLASVGPWLIEIDATRDARLHASLPAPIDHTLLVRGRVIAVDERGGVFEWDRSGAPRSLGTFAAPVASLLADGDALIALASKRALQRFELASGVRAEVARFDPGTAPLLALAEPRRWVVMRSDGSWLSAESGARVPSAVSSASGVTQPDAVADPTGAVAWWAANAPLHLETAPGVGRELAEVRCTVPASLVPAGPSRLVAACGSGLVWLIGPSGSASAPP